MSNLAELIPMTDFRADPVEGTHVAFQLKSGDIYVGSFIQWTSTTATGRLLRRSYAVLKATNDVELRIPLTSIEKGYWPPLGWRPFGGK
jgi:hypothetical protein